MDIHIYWIVALSIATPIAGVVGFAVQLRHVKKARLENEKLQLEIVALKEQAAAAGQLIVKPTNEEVLKVKNGQPMFSRARHLESRSGGVNGAAAIGDSELISFSEQKVSFKEKVLAVAAVSAAALLVAYLVYDNYRLITWAISKL